MEKKLLLFELTEEVRIAIKKVFPITSKTQFITGAIGNIRIPLDRGSKVWETEYRQLEGFPNLEIDYCKERDILIIKNY